ncbi:monocarboxylate transporter 12-like [Glandiceps talaboti]
MSDISEYSANPPDGGWGWFVVLATFIVTAFGPGSYYAFGVLYVAFLDAFGESKAATSLVTSMSAFIFVMMGPVGLASSRKFGHRKTVIAAGLIMSVGLFATSVTTSLYQVYFTYSIITGCGGGMALIASVEMVGVYFKKRLSLAIGLAMAGAGAGQFILSVVTQILVDKYGWRGTLMILSAMTANICVAGALFRPLNDNTTKPKEYKTIPSNENIFINNELTEHVAILDHVKDKSSPNASTKTKSDERKTKTKSGCVCGLKSFLGSLYDVSLFKEPLYYLLILTGISQMIYVIMFGIGLGGYIVMVPVVVSYFLGAKRMGYGLSSVGQAEGITGLFIGPLSGWMRDTSGSYDGAFWLSAIVLVIGAIVTMLLPVVDKLLKRKRQTSDVTESKIPNQGGTNDLLVAECMTTI